MSFRVSPVLLALITLSIISPNPLWAESHGQISAPEFHKQSLLNGMEILFLPGSERRAPFVLMIKNGAAFDPIEKWGVTYLTTWMILEEAENQTGLPIQRNLRQLGAELYFGVEWDAIFFFGSAPIDRVVEVLSLLGEMVVRPKFLEETFERLRDQLVQEIEKERKDPQVLTQELFLAELFQANPYAHSVKGTAETLRNLYLTDLKIQYRKLFLPNQAQLAFYYSGDRDRVFTELSRRWGSWVKNKPLPFTFRKAESPKGRRILLIDSPSADSLFRWGNLTVEKGSRDYYALKILEQYLTLSWPAWADQAAPENQIQASFQLEARIMPGYLQLNIQAPAEGLIAYFQKLEDLVQDLQDGRIDVQKFEEAKQLAHLELTASLEQPLPRLYRLLETNLYNLGINFITHYGTRLNRVTPKHFANVVQRYVSLQNFLLLVAGPSDQLKAELDEIGSVKMR